MKPEERFTRALFGVIMIGSVFFSWGKWVVAALGALFIASAACGAPCLLCKVTNIFVKHKT